MKIQKFIVRFLLVFGIFSQEVLCFQYSAEIKVGYFIPTNELFRKIYGGGGIYNLELSTPVWDCVEAWAGVGYFTQTGHSIGLGDPTHITIVPITLGLKYYFPLTNFFDGYVGIGAQANYLHMHDQSPFVIEHISKWGIGGIAKAGVICYLENCFFLDFFVDYSFCRIPFHRTDNIVIRNTGDISGFSVGTGLGYDF